MPGDARCAAARCIPPAIRASRGAGPAGSGAEHDRRFSFCCAVDGCRSRATPPSLRFLGRKVYLAAIVVLVAVMRHGVTTSRMERLSQAVGVDRRTVERWRRWWRDSFTATPFWRMPAPRSCRRSIMGVCRHRCSSASAAMMPIASSRCCASSAPSPEAARTLDKGVSSSAQDARRRHMAAASTVGAIRSEERRHDPAATRHTCPRAVGASALFRDRPAVGGATRQGRIEGRDRGARRPHLAASDHGRSGPVRLRDHRALVLPGLEGAQRSGRRAPPQAARRRRTAGCDRRCGAPGRARAIRRA